MKRFLDTVQKQIGTLISVIGLFVYINNFVGYYFVDGMSLAQSLVQQSALAVMILVIPFIISMFVENSILKTFQVLALVAMGAWNVIDDWMNFYGPALFLLAWLLARHYGFLESHAVAKNVAWLAVVTALSQASATLHGQYGVTDGLNTLFFSLFLISILVIIWRDIIRQQKMLRMVNKSLQMDYNKLSEKLRELDQNHLPYDLKSAKITPAEERVIKVLTVYKASNREIAERLNIAESTVKLHMYNICNKIGVDNRFAIMDLCKYNFTS